MEQRPDRVVRIDAADPLDGGLRHRLAVGDDRQGLERRRREADGVRADVAGDEGAAFRCGRELDPVAVDQQADAPRRAARPRGRRAGRRRSPGPCRQARRSRAATAASRRRTGGLRGRPRSARSARVPRRSRRRRASAASLGRAGVGAGSSRRAPPRPARARRVTRTTPVTRRAARRRPPARSRRAARSSAVVARATIGPHGVACSTTISRRFMSSSMARNVTAMTTRSRTPASRSWRTTVGASRRAARMISARSVSVMMRPMASGGGSGGGAMAARRSRARTSRAGSRVGASAGRAPASAAAWAAAGSRRNSPIRAQGIVAQAADRRRDGRGRAGVGHAARPRGRCPRRGAPSGRSGRSGAGASPGS